LDNGICLCSTCHSCVHKKISLGEAWGDAVVNTWIELGNASQPWLGDTSDEISDVANRVLKYLMRMGSKDERLKEAKKAAHYARKLVEVLEK